MSTEAPRKKPSILVIVLVVIGLCFTCICGVGIASSLGIPIAINYTRRAKTEEAHHYLRELRIAITAHCEVRRGGSPIAAGPVPATPSATKQVGDFAADPGFATLRFRIADPVHYSYSVTPEPAGAYVLAAEGDLDGDGTRSRFEVRCDATCACSPMTSTNELE
jgi:hypothetical protein